MLNKANAKKLEKLMIAGMIYGFVVGGVLYRFNIDISETEFVGFLKELFPAIGMLAINNQHPSLAISLWSVLLVSAIPFIIFSVFYFKEKLIEKFSFKFIATMFSIFLLLLYNFYFGLRNTMPSDLSPSSSQFIHLTKSGTILYISLLMNANVSFITIIISMLLKTVRIK